MKEYKYADITKKVIGAAMKVHATLGNGFQEVIYQRASEIEMTKTQLSFAREFSMPIFYDSILTGERRVDFLDEGLICVEGSIGSGALRPGKKLSRSIQYRSWIVTEFRHSFS